MDIFIAGWNTNLVKKEEEPKEFDDFADPKWKNRLIAEPTDEELLIGLAKYKFKSDEQGDCSDEENRRQQSGISQRVILNWPNC